MKYSIENKFLKFLFIILIFFIFLLDASKGISRDGREARSLLDPFSESYLFMEAARNFPQSFSLSQFKAGGLHPVAAYRYNLMGHWVMGLGIQFKNFERQKINIIDNESRSNYMGRNFALWTFFHEGLYVIRLDHPTYFLIGPKLLYLLPSKVASFPIVRDDAFSVEIGGGLSGSLIRILGYKSFVSLRVDRWRGTTTNKIHGLEIACGFGYSL